MLAIAEGRSTQLRQVRDNNHPQRTRQINNLVTGSHAAGEHSGEQMGSRLLLRTVLNRTELL